MFCIGAPTARVASTKPGQSFAWSSASSASAVRSSSASPVQASASTRSAPKVVAASAMRSESTGPWRVSRTLMVTGGAPLTRMTSSRTANGAEPSGVR